MAVCLFDYDYASNSNAQFIKQDAEVLCAVLMTDACGFYSKPALAADISSFAKLVPQILDKKSSREQGANLYQAFIDLRRVARNIKTGQRTPTRVHRLLKLLKIERHVMYTYVFVPWLMYTCCLHVCNAHRVHVCITST